MKSLNSFGLKNFRVFDDIEGIFEEFTSINILTGANNSGKSSIVKFLQLLKNSVKENQYPFDLDLTQQGHLLGDFDNILFNKENKDVIISLPFPFLGIKTIYISLLFTIPDNDTYHAKLRKIEVIDKIDDVMLFSFIYIPATDTEKELDEQEFKIKLERYKTEEAQQKTDDLFSFNYSDLILADPLIGYIKWSINFDKLKYYLKEILKFYKVYLERKNERNFLVNEDKAYKSSHFIPSILINSFKGEISIDIWNNFLENQMKNVGIIKGTEYIREVDFESDYFSPPPSIEEVLYDRVLKINRENINWFYAEGDRFNNSIIAECFKSSWETLLQRISTINYLSNIKEENSRIYNANLNSPFINLLKEYLTLGLHYSPFINKYLKEFSIGKRINIKSIPKYQLIEVSIDTFDNYKRELVDFGYGIKQLVILLIQIAVLARRNKREIEEYYENGEYVIKDIYNQSILLIEEPEANLHPKWQSLLAKLFVEAATKFNIQLIVETHSEYLIRRLQTLVAKDEIDGKDITIFYLRNLYGISLDKKQIETTHIEPDGTFNYKIFDGGFFDENDELELSLLNIQRSNFLKEFEDLKKNKEENKTKLSELEQKIDEYTNKLNISVYQQIVIQQFDPSKLAQGSLGYLTSGQFLLNTIDHQSDFSPVIIQYGRTIENELKAVFMQIGINTKKLMLGFMQGSLEKFKLGTTQQKHCSSGEFGQLQIELTNSFNTPLLLKIELLNDLRELRNSASHAGQAKTKQEAIDYIQKANEFLDKWIDEKK